MSYLARHYIGGRLDGRAPLLMAETAWQPRPEVPKPKRNRTGEHRTQKPSAASVKYGGYGIFALDVAEDLSVPCDNPKNMRRKLYHWIMNQDSSQQFNLRAESGSVKITRVA